MREPTILKKIPKEIKKTKLLYKYKNIRIYHLGTAEGNFLRYWVAILLLDENNKGKILPFADLRTFPTWRGDASDFLLRLEPHKHIPHLYRDAIRLDCIKNDMYITWEKTTFNGLTWKT